MIVRLVGKVEKNMLTIQPKLLNIYHPAFKANEKIEGEQLTLADLDEDTYQSMRDELETRHSEFEELTDNDEFKLPEPINKVLKGGAVVTTGLLGGMATGWGTKKSLGGLNKLANTKAVKTFKNSIINTKIKTINASKSLKTKFLQTKFYTKISNTINNAYTKFGEKKFGKPVVKFLNTIGKGIKKAYTTVSTGIKNIWNKIRGVKKETWEKSTINTVGASGGIAASVNSLKEKDGAED